jgi:TP901 family phage tail tape measure protein
MASRTAGLQVTIAGDARGLQKATADAERSLGRLSKSADTHSKSTMLSFGKVAGAAGVVGGAFVALGASVVKTAAGYQKAMAEVKAVSGASAAEMNKLSKAALRLGQSSGLGATKAAQAIAELAKGGLATKDIIDGGLTGAMALAQAGALDLADAASGTANALNLFGLSGRDATHVADAFATAANATTADVSDFTLALSQGGSAAKAAGLSFDQTTVALEALAAVGVKSSDAGTSLKTALTHLANPTKQAAQEMKKLGLNFFDTTGRIKPLADISEMLRARMGKLTNQQRLQAAATIAGTDGMRALLALFDAGPGKLNRFEQGLRKQGTAAAVAAQKQAGFTGSLNKFRATIETVSIQIGTLLLPALTRGLNAINRFVTGMQKGTGAGGDFARTMRDLDDALGPVAHGLAVGVNWLSKHSTAMKLALNPVTNFVTQMKGLAVVLKAVEDAVKGVVSAVKSIPGLFKGAAGAVSGLVGKLNPFGDGLGRTASSLRLPSGGGSGGSLMGARSSLAPFAAVGGRFGLHVTDGKRPAGTRTSSGGISYHSTGEAIDMGDGRGPDPQKLAYFKYMKSRFGGRLAELIYTPGGAGIKDGRPYNYTGTTAAEHYDHVHVAFDSGVPGIGDGPGRKPGRYAGDGLGFNAVAKLAESVGLPGVTFAQIAHGESSYNPRAIGHDPGGTTGYGLWQITSGFNDDIIRKYGGPAAMLNPHTNALAARDIWRRQGKAAWYGTRYVTGWNLHYKGGSGGSSSGGGKGSKPSGPKTGRGGSSVTLHQPSAGSSPFPHILDPQNPADVFYAKQHGIPIAPTKGVARDGGSGGSSSGGDTGDPNQPLIDAQNAAAAAAQALADQLAGVKASIDAQTAFASGVSNTSNYQLTKTLADLISGHIVGYGVAGRAFTPGTGVEVAY